jgi:hypothetical protein
LFEKCHIEDLEDNITMDKRVELALGHVHRQVLILKAMTLPIMVPDCYFSHEDALLIFLNLHGSLD